MTQVQKFVVAMDQSISDRVDKHRTSLAYTPPELYDMRYEELKSMLKTHLRHHLHTHGFPVPSPEDRPEYPAVEHQRDMALSDGDVEPGSSHSGS